MKPCPIIKRDENESRDYLLPPLRRQLTPLSRGNQRISNLNDLHGVGFESVFTPLSRTSTPRVDVAPSYSSSSSFSLLRGTMGRVLCHSTSELSVHFPPVDDDSRGYRARLMAQVYVSKPCKYRCQRWFRGNETRDNATCT